MDFDGVLGKPRVQGSYNPYEPPPIERVREGLLEEPGVPLLKNWKGDKKPEDYSYHFCAGGRAYYRSYYYTYDEGNTVYYSNTYRSGSEYVGLDRKPKYEVAPHTKYEVAVLFSEDTDKNGGTHLTAYYDCCCDDGTPGMCTLEEAEALEKEKGSRLPPAKEKRAL